MVQGSEDYHSERANRPRSVRVRERKSEGKWRGPTSPSDRTASLFCSCSSRSIPCGRRRRPSITWHGYLFGYGYCLPAYGTAHRSALRTTRTRTRTRLCTWRRAPRWACSAMAPRVAAWDLHMLPDVGWWSVTFVGRLRASLGVTSGLAATLPSFRERRRVRVLRSTLRHCLPQRPTHYPDPSRYPESPQDSPRPCSAPPATAPCVS